MQSLPPDNTPQYGWESRPNPYVEADFSDANIINLNTGKKPSLNLFYLVSIGLFIFVMWASVFEIDQAVRAQGTVIPSARTQVIQAADGGVLETLYVREGDQVIKGQKLAAMEKGRASASFQEIRAQIAGLKTSLIRAQAESIGEEPNFSAIEVEFSDLVQGQQALYNQNKRSLDDALFTVESALLLAEEELDMNQSLFMTGDISRLDVMRNEREVNDLLGEKDNITNEFRQRASQQAADIENQLATAEFQLEEKLDLLDHTVLTAPVDGVVKYLAISTLGGVLRAGDELMHISPTQGGVVIEAKILPMDIGQLELGMPVSIQLDAFDFSIYGSLEGELIYLSSDTLTEQTERGNLSFYRAQVALTKSNDKINLTDVKQGMTATADIKTGNRTVLEFIAKPIIRGFSGALIQK